MFNLVYFSHNNNGDVMKKIVFLISFLFFIDFVGASDIYISKKDIDTGEYVLDCDFLLVDDAGNVIDSWIQDDSYHISSVESGSYKLVSRPYIMGVFNDDMSDSYKLDVGDSVVNFTIYNKKVVTPKNLSVSYNYIICGVFFIVFGGIFILFYSKYSLD